MNALTPAEGLDAVVEIEAPGEQRIPLVFASPHSGSSYPPEFVASSALDPQTLRRSEDAFVDLLFAAAPDCGAPLLKALFPRAFLDPNREPWELDPAMFEDALPAYANTGSPRVAAGLGTIARVVASGAEIYRGKLRFAEAEARIRRCYAPYHSALNGLIEETRKRFGCCLLVDCHSMPSIGGPGDTDAGSARVDFVLGDCYGTSCAAGITAAAETALKGLGYKVVRNTPYAGGFTTRHYGRPETGTHAVQIEINRQLYMDEASHRRRPSFARLQKHLAALVATLATLPLADLAA